MNVINLAYGPIIALGMFGVYLLFTNLHAPLPDAHRRRGYRPALHGHRVIAIHRVINAPHLSTLLATFAVVDIIGPGTAAFSTTPRNVDFSAG